MFYRKHRPQTLQELDNPSVKERLLAILGSSELPHAFLFTGPKGTGKTSTARILAKIINCEKLLTTPTSTFEPCNTCDMCIAITKGTALDVVELDGASNRRIDDMRQLTNSVNLSPVYGTYKVYIIDEVHMLTTEAFNALLKTLEEPPSHVIFILATTEEDKLPSTIVSRCVVVQFQKATIEHIKIMIEKIKQREGFVIEEDAIELIAQHSDGSFRDASKVLEEAIKSKKITVDSVESVVNVGKADNLLKAIEERSVEKAITYIQSYEHEGKSFKSLIESLLTSLHEILLEKKGVTGTTSGTSLTLEQALDLTKRLQQAYKELRFSPIEQLPLELALIEHLSRFPDPKSKR